MKTSTIIVFVFISFSSQILIGQTLYGLKKTVNGNMSIPFDVVNINPSNGNTTFKVSTNSHSSCSCRSNCIRSTKQNAKFLLGDDNSNRLYVEQWKNF